MCLPPLKLRPINNNDHKSHAVHATEYHLQKMMANVIVGGKEGGGGVKAR